MRFHHHAKIFRGQIDLAPFASVFFLLLIFILLHSALVFTPGVPINLPTSPNLPGPTRPTVALAVDGDGLMYLENQIITEDQLRERLTASAQRAKAPLTLILHADREVRYERLVQVALLAREAGIPEALLATRLAVVPQAAAKPTNP